MDEVKLKCPTCGSVDGVALWIGDAFNHREWHEENSECFDASCHPCPLCTIPKQEQPKAGLLTPAQELEAERIRSGMLSTGWKYSQERLESALTENKDLRERIEALESREEWLEERVMVLSAMECKVKRLREAIVLLSDYGEGECWCDIMSQSEDSPHTKICLAAREALKE